MWSLILFWLAGGFATLGGMKAISKYGDADIDNEVYFVKFIQSWYAFGMMIVIMLTEIGEKIDNK